MEIKSFLIFFFFKFFHFLGKKNGEMKAIAILFQKSEKDILKKEGKKRAD